MLSSQPRARLACLAGAGSSRSPGRVTTLSPQHSSLNASALQFALENLFSNVKPSPSCYRVSQIFHPFSHMAPCPLQMGGGVTFSFPKNTTFGPLCVFFEKSQLKYKHFSHFFSIFLALSTQNWSKISKKLQTT